tara:strand:+ start:3218 stop:5239 length:2022 start_codon:yes stop_codon:yes gene_type:complete
MLAQANEVYSIAFIAGLAPDKEILISEWAEENRVLPSETTSKPGKWRNDNAPHLVEIMDCFSPSHPCDEITFIKSAQIAGSEGIMNAIGYVIDVAPGPGMVVHPSKEAGADWVKEKLNPNIDENPVLEKKVQEQVSRKSGSSAMFKKFPGGFWVVTGANSSKGLRQKSIRYLIKDDWDEWPFDIGGQGDPDKMADARQISFHDAGTAKKLQVSTPTNTATSRVHKAYERSDQRVFEVECPHCGGRQELYFFPKKVGKKDVGGLRFNKTAPYEAYYVCEHNGCIIESHEKYKMMNTGKWIARNPGGGRHPGFKINALYSLFTTWDKMVDAFINAKDSPFELKTFYNLWLGQAWEERGEAPDWKRLLTLREDYRLGRIPLGPLLLTCAVDVQGDGFYYEVVGWGIGKTSWTVDKGFLAGNTEMDTTWKLLDDLYQRKYENPWGQAFGFDALAIDSGYLAHHVYTWARGKPKVIVVKGAHGPQKPLIGVPSKVDIDHKGRKIKDGMDVYPAGVWQGKTEFYSYLRLEGTVEGKERDPLGYCHFSKDCDENYFKQLTSESLVRHKNKAGRDVAEWVVTGQNHYLDCRIYNFVAAEHLGISRMTMEKWEALATIRNVPAESLQGDLLSLENRLSSTPQGEAKKTGDDKDPEPAKPKPSSRAVQSQARRAVKRRARKRT